MPGAIVAAREMTTKRSKPLRGAATSAAAAGFGEKFWRAADKLRGHESDYTTWRLARMNFAIRGIDSGQIAQGNH